MPSQPLMVLGTYRSSLEICHRLLCARAVEGTEELTRLNDELLEAAADRTGSRDPGALADALRTIDGEWVRRAEHLVAAASEHGDPVLIDPELCLALPFWQRILPAARYVIWYAHPGSVVEALERRDGLSRAEAERRWSEYFHAALSHTRGAPRVIVSVHELLEAPAYELDRFGRQLRELGLESVPFDAARDAALLADDGDEATVAHALLDEPRPRFLGSSTSRTVAPRRSVEVLSDADVRPDAAERRAAIAAHREKRDARARAALEERRATAVALFKAFPRRLGQTWLDQAHTLNEGARVRWENGCGWRPKVMIGTLSSGERELESCRRSVGRQAYRDLEHVVLSDLPKKEAVATLMERFHAGDADLLIKLDADMVLLDESFVERVIAVFDAAEDVDMLQMAVLDYFSGRTIQGINAYRQGFAWRTSEQDRLFTDKTQVPKERRLVNWATFRHAAVHAPDPHPFHAYHFGVHRGLKVLQPDAPEPREDQMLEQLVYLEATWQHFRARRDPRLALAALGFEQALAGEHRIEDLDYTNPSLARTFERHASLGADELEREVLERRAAAVPAATVERARSRRRQAYWASSEPVRRILVLLPHFGVFGGVNRFFYLARAFADLGVECVLAQPDAEARSHYRKRLPETRPDHPDVRTALYSEVLGESWDVVVCGDYTSGAMLTLPLFEARVSAIYLLNGWLRREANLRQAQLAEPDVVIANSSYVARYYADLAPVVVAGGIDPAGFRPEPGQRSLRDAPRDPAEPFRVLAYGGRRKHYKRFEDVARACELLHAGGVPVELNVFDERTVEIDATCPTVNHGALSRDQLQRVLNGMDLLMSGEEEAGWSNPCAEALASGVPVVCTEAGTTDFAHDGETALVVPARKPEALAQAARRIYDDPALGARLARTGSERMREFAWADVARRLHDVFTAAARDDSRRQALDRRARGRIERQVLAA